MAQATDTDIRKIKDLILGLDKKSMKLRQISTSSISRLIKVEKRTDKQDTRLWAFGGIILAAALGTIVKLLAFPTASVSIITC
jgi:hypothetical protein